MFAGNVITIRFGKQLALQLHIAFMPRRVP